VFRDPKKAEAVDLETGGAPPRKFLALYVLLVVATPRILEETLMQELPKLDFSPQQSVI
jgi:hypothetical protein